MPLGNVAVCSSWGRQAQPVLGTGYADGRAVAWPCMGVVCSQRAPAPLDCFSVSAALASASVSVPGLVSAGYPIAKRDACWP